MCLWLKTSFTQISVCVLPKSSDAFNDNRGENFRSRDFKIVYGRNGHGKFVHNLT